MKLRVHMCAWCRRAFFVGNHPFMECKWCSGEHRSCKHGNVEGICEQPECLVKRVMLK